MIPLRYMMLTRKTDKEKAVLNPRTGKMLIELRNGNTLLKTVNKQFIERCINDALSGQNGWDIVFYDDVEPVYKEKL